MNDFTPSEFWKNFRLGTELTVSGNFIYNGLHCFDLMPHFYYEDESFEFLYNIAVGIERLQKITLILVEHNENVNQEEFEKSLITHNHSELHKRINKIQPINLGKVHLKFLSLLSTFYKSVRYERYNLQSVFSPEKGRSELINFIQENLKAPISIDFFGCTTNDVKIKKFIGRVIGKICTEYYEQIINECKRLNIYTYEISIESKAFKIFMSKKFDFTEEKLIQKEIIKYLIQGNLSEGFNEYIKHKAPLDLEFYNTNHYISYLMSYHKNIGIKGEIEELYSEMNDLSERINHLEPIGNNDVDFDFEIDNYDES